MSSPTPWTPGPWRVRAVERWNAQYEVGTRVYYWPGLRKGPGTESATCTPAHLLGGHTPVVWVEGRGDCIALTHVEPIGGNQ